MKPQSEELSQFLNAYYQNTSEMIIFIDQEGKVIYMNHAAKRVISPNNIFTEAPHTICGRCEGHTNEYGLQTCFNCFLESEDLGGSTFQVFMKTTDDTIEPFTASYQTIDEKSKLKLLHYKTSHLSYNDRKNSINAT